jgi:RNA polymerase sigma-70 factor (ECF subfamily)
MEVKDLLAQADRQIRSQRRQERRRHTEYIDGVTDTAATLPYDDFAELVSKGDCYKRLYAAIEKLSDIQRRRVYLYYFGRFSCRQIAEYESISVNSVALSLTRAVENLKRSMLVP